MTSVLHVTGGYPPEQEGGAYAYTAWLHRRLRARGLDSTVLTRPLAAGGRVRRCRAVPGDGRVLRITNPRIRNWDAHWDVATSLGATAWAEVATSAISDLDPAIVHVHSVVGLPVAFLRHLSASGRRVVLTHHDYGVCCPRFTLQRDGERTCPTAGHGSACAPCAWEGPRWAVPVARRLDQVLPVSGTPVAHGMHRIVRPHADRRQHLYRRWYEIGTELVAAAAVNIFPTTAALGAFRRALEADVRGAVLPYPLPDELVAAHARWSGYVPGRAGLLLGFMGTDQPLKGLDVLLKALRLLPARVRLRVMGRLSDRSCRRITSQLTDRVEIVRDYRLGDLPELLRDVDAVVVPSTWEETGPPMVTSEAQLFGVPVVASRLGGMTAAVADGHNGVLFRPGDHRGLADQLRELLDDPSRLRAMSAQARPLATTEAEHLDRLLHLYAVGPRGALGG
ncbi:MAG TPA: glycosyltransferase [Nitriliruptorales bacterium]|nr:glycosyltransferase [Nitriliruptorales bacterium]